MASFDQYYHPMPDGTIKQVNPFSTTEVWCVPERGRKPIINTPPEHPEKIYRRDPEDYCHFCSANYIFTPPEKDRVYRDEKGKWHKIRHIQAEELHNNYADFRRVGNLFEIVTYDYWNKNYNYQINDECKKWQNDYLGSKAGFEHIMNVLGLKYRMMGLDFDSTSVEERIEKSLPFFGGCHELIVGGRHYSPGAEHNHDICSSGSLTPEEHYQYIKLAVETILDIYRQNPFVRYISIFQNWLRPAGASLDHLHKQFVGLDEWGVQISREIKELIKNPNLYNELAANFAIYYDFMIAENDYAMAFSEIGHRYPTIAVYSKSDKCRPFEQSEEEIRGMSDLMHAIHRAVTNQTACNEEWYYSPFDSIYSSPWHILIKLRIHNPAGFEGNTKIYINPVNPEKLRDVLVEAMVECRSRGEIASGLRIGDEVNKRPNPLQYYKGKGELGLWR